MLFCSSSDVLLSFCCLIACHCVFSIPQRTEDQTIKFGTEDTVNSKQETSWFVVTSSFVLPSHLHLSTCSSFARLNAVSCISGGVQLFEWPTPHFHPSTGNEFSVIYCHPASGSCDSPPSHSSEDLLLYWSRARHSLIKEKSSADPCGSMG